MKITFKLISSFLAISLLTACSAPAPNPTDSTPTPTETPETATSTEDNDTIVGSFLYFINPSNTAQAAYYQNLKNRLCFEPAQLETINDGSIFCFTNTDIAKTALQIPADETKCDYYSGVAEIKIFNLTDKNLTQSKADPCVENGSCEFNEAEFLSVLDNETFSAPDCRQNN